MSDPTIMYCQLKDHDRGMDKHKLPACDMHKTSITLALLGPQSMTIVSYLLTGPKSAVARIAGVANPGGGKTHVGSWIVEVIIEVKVNS